jgi:hypothetical protein
MFTFITLPTDLTAQIAVGAGGIFTDMLPVGLIVVGVALGLYLLSWTISRFKGIGGKK